MDRVVGRGQLLDHAWEALSSRRRVLLHGPAGAGKSTLLTALAERAEEANWQVLAARPTEEEQSLAHVGLADLLAPIVGRPIAFDHFDASTATETAYSLLNHTDPATTLVLLDDTNWLDEASAAALRFVLRRLELPVVMAVRHENGPIQTPLGLHRAPGGVMRLDVEALPVAAIRELLRSRLGPMPRAVVTRIAEECRGNPLLALGLAEAVLRSEQMPTAFEDLPSVLDANLAVTEARLLRLPEATRHGLRLAALLAAPTPAVLHAAGVDLAALDEAELAGLIDVSHDSIRFSHPLFAAAARADLSSVERRRLHETLADHVTDPDERARQLSRCQLLPSDNVALLLADSGDRHHHRGATAMASSLLLRAAELSEDPGSEVAQLRRVRAARAAFSSGDFPTAMALAQSVIDGSEGLARAEAFLALAIIGWSENYMEIDSAALVEEALNEVAADSVTAGRLLAHLAVFSPSQIDGSARAKQAIDILKHHPDEWELLASSYFVAFHADAHRGERPDPALLEAGLAAEAGRESWLGGGIPAQWWTGTDQHERAHARWLDILRDEQSKGSDPGQIDALLSLTFNALVGGELAAALQFAEDAFTLGTEIQSPLLEERFALAEVAVELGDLGSASSLMQQIRADYSAMPPWAVRRLEVVSGDLEFALGNDANAVEHYERLADLYVEAGLRDVWGVRYEHTWIDAAVRLDNRASAERAVGELERRQALAPRPWISLALARASVLLASVTELEPAVANLADVLNGLGPDVIPLHQARSRLVLGKALRRLRRKAAARDALEAAADTFAACGAAIWEHRTRAEIARLGERVGAPTELTPTESRIAVLAAEGATNAEIATNLFVSPKTVEANLARAYRKLGIARRAELARALGQL